MSINYVHTHIHTQFVSSKHLVCYIEQCICSLQFFYELLISSLMLWTDKGYSIVHVE